MDGVTSAVTALTGVSIVLAFAVFMFRILRPLFNIKVNCWFCNADTRVAYRERESWHCPQCDQYNGFSQDGGYNKPIPAQYEANLNRSVTSEATSNDTSATSDEPSVLCATCQQNQLLKVKQLANFVPFNEDNFDAEAEAFSHHLENLYRLCRVCERRVNATLTKQDATLRHKLEECRYYDKHNASNLSDNSVSSVFSTDLMCQKCAPFHIRFLRVIAALCAVVSLILSGWSLLDDSCLDLHVSAHFLPEVVLIYVSVLSETQPALTLLGLFSSYASVYLSGKDKLLLTDAVAAFSWLGLLLLVSGALDLLVTREDRLLMMTMLALLCAAACIANCLLTRGRRAYKRRIRKRRSLQANNESSISDVSTTDNAQVSTVPDSSVNRPEENESLRQRVNASTARENSDDRRPEAPILSHIDRMTLGPPSHHRNRPKGMFSGVSDAPQFASSSSLSSLHQQRPLISPARFKFVPRPHAHHSSLISESAPTNHNSSISRSLFSSHPPTDSTEDCDNFSDNDFDEDSTADNPSSSHPVSSSPASAAKTSGAAFWSLMVKASILVNVLLLAYICYVNI